MFATTPPAYVRPSDIHPIITAEQLAEEAMHFGRKSVQDAIAAGDALLRSLEVWKGKKMAWFAMVRTKGLSRRTAERLMTKARNAAKSAHMRNSPEYLYDDGWDPSADAGKRPCRDCRIRGKTFSKDCPGCRALNRPTPKPKDERVLDMDGQEVPVALAEAFADGQTIRDFNSYLLKGTKSLVGLLERPGCKALNVEEITRRLRKLFQYANKYRPGKVCTGCEGNGCTICSSRGWITVMAVEDERAALKAADRRQKAKQRREALQSTQELNDALLE
jgi:hypothetical protein